MKIRQLVVVFYLHAMSFLFHKPCVAGQSADETDFKLDAAQRFTLEPCSNSYDCLFEIRL